MTYTPMPTVPTVPDAAWGQLVNDNMTFLGEDRPALLGYVIAQDVPTETPTVLDLELEATVDGLYLVCAHVASTSSPDGGTRRYVRVWRNGTDAVAMRQGRSALNGTFYSEVNDLVRLDEGDTLTVQVYQDSAATQTYLARVTALLVAP